MDWAGRIPATKKNQDPCSGWDRQTRDRDETKTFGLQDLEKINNFMVWDWDQNQTSKERSLKTNLRLCKACLKTGLENHNFITAGTTTLVSISLKPWCFGTLLYLLMEFDHITHSFYIVTMTSWMEPEKVSAQGISNQAKIELLSPILQFPRLVRILQTDVFYLNFQTFRISPRTLLRRKG